MNVRSIKKMKFRRNYQFFKNNLSEYPVQYERADLEFFIPELLSEN